MKLEQAGRHPWLQIDADRTHVAEQLLRRLLEQEAQAAFAPTAGRVEEVGGEARLSGAGGPGHENRAPAVDPCR